NNAPFAAILIRLAGAKGKHNTTGPQIHIGQVERRHFTPAPPGSEAIHQKSAITSSQRTATITQSFRHSTQQIRSQRSLTSRPFLEDTSRIIDQLTRAGIHRGTKTSSKMLVSQRRQMRADRLKPVAAVMDTPRHKQTNRLSSSRQRPPASIDTPAGEDSTRGPVSLPGVD